MREVGIGRVLVASLHQGISDVLPTRLGFYENWLDAKGLREGTIGIAPLRAVLSFLRLEEGHAYQTIATKAGEYAAEWTVDSLPSVQRTLLRRAPAWLRVRLVLRLFRRLVQDTYQESHATIRLRRGTASVAVLPSVFCTVREPVEHPLCGYYAAAFARLLVLFDVRVQARIVTCRGRGESSCSLTAVVVEPVAA